MLKFILDNWYLFALALASGGLLVWPLIQRSSMGGAIGTGEAVRLINREKAVLIDVSEPAEFAASHAANARSVPLAQLLQPKMLPSNKTLPLVLLCPTGNRSAKAAATLRKAGYEKATSVAGGTAAWRDASLPVDKSDKPAGAEKGGKAA